METNNEKQKKEVSVFINGQRHMLEKIEISYEDIVTLAFGHYENNPNVVYTIIYLKGNNDKPKGEIVKGETIKLKDQMIINVTRTDRS